MGSFLMVEAGYETGQLMARLRTHGGKALLSFLLALFSFCNTGESTDMDLDRCCWRIGFARRKLRSLFPLAVHGEGARG